ADRHARPRRRTTPGTRASAVLDHHRHLPACPGGLAMTVNSDDGPFAVLGLGQLREARTVILAAPVDAAIDLLTRAAPFLDRATLITDVGSTKGAIVAHAQALGLGDRFVGSHPLAGDHRSGW